MRPKIILAIVLPALLVIAVAVFHKSPPVSPVPAVITDPVSVAATVVTNQAITPEPEPSPAPTPKVTKTPTAEERQVAVDAEIDRLSDWSMNDDPQSLSNILGDLSSPEKEIRVAAIEAAKQFQSTDAIPALRAAAAAAVSAGNGQEAVDMIEAADWLALPSADFHAPATKPQLTAQQTQSIQQNSSEAASRRQAYMQKHHPDQNTSSTPSAGNPNATQGN